MIGTYHQLQSPVIGTYHQLQSPVIGTYYQLQSLVIATYYQLQFPVIATTVASVTVPSGQDKLVADLPEVEEVRLLLVRMSAFW